MQGTFHRRELKSPAVEFSSDEGKLLFKGAMQEGNLEGYFYLAEHFMTQGHPAFCGIGSLTMALNSLLVDPNRVWKGVWRWFDESMLDCCEPLDIVQLQGITLSKLSCLARCNGAMPILKYADQLKDVEEFRNDIIHVCKASNTLISSSSSSSSSRSVMIVSYSRKGLNQTGVGHFSPIGVYVH